MLLAIQWQQEVNYINNIKGENNDTKNQTKFGDLVFRAETRN